MYHDRGVKMERNPHKSNITNITDILFGYEALKKISIRIQTTIVVANTIFIVAQSLLLYSYSNSINFIQVSFSLKIAILFIVFNSTLIVKKRVDSADSLRFLLFLLLVFISEFLVYGILENNIMIGFVIFFILIYSILSAFYSIIKLHYTKTVQDQNDAKKLMKDAKSLSTTFLGESKVKI